MNDLEELLTRGVANIIPGKNELFGKLASGKKLNIYLGIDPTSTKIHLGHAVVLRKLQAFAEKGHNVTLVIGDFTALIGDTSDKDSERPLLSRQEIEQNFRTYKQQAKIILDFSKIKVRYNSEWFRELDFSKIVQLCQLYSVGDFISRELIHKRLAEGKRVGLHEFLYPVMQAYDSYSLKTDLQIGGTDQTFNMQAGRTLIKATEKRESFVLTTLILEGSDGRKMSKSLGNAIWLEDNSNDMYTKVMSINDDLMITYFTLATNLSLSEINDIQKKLKKENPINIKKALALEIVKELHGGKEAEKAQKEFEKTVQNKELPDRITLFPVKNFNQTVFEIISDWAQMSNSELKRLIQQRGVEVDGNKITIDEASEKVSNGMIIKIGSKRIVKISSK